VRLTNVEAGSLEVIATLGEVRGDGIVLSEIGELGSGPRLCCPWDSLKRVQDRPPRLRIPHEEAELGEEPQETEYYELYGWREAPAEEVMPEPLQKRQLFALNLERVVSIAQLRTVGEITVALASPEFFGEGLGVLRHRISYEEAMFECGIPETELVIRDGSGRELPWSPQGASSSDSETGGEVEICDLPETGELEVTRLVSLVFGEEVAEDPYESPWIFSFTI
jgi:hypothetical protein